MSLTLAYLEQIGLQVYGGAGASGKGRNPETGASMPGGGAAPFASAPLAPLPRTVDAFELEVSTPDEDCAAALSSYYDAVLAYRPFPAWGAASRAAVERDRECPLAHILAADCAFCRGEAETAKAHLTEVQAEGFPAKDTWTDRERRYLKAWECWVLKGDPGGCYRELLAILSDYPSDLFALKRAQIMGLLLGDGAKILAAAEAVAAQLDASAPPPRYLHGMWAFGLEQQGKYEDAEAKAREGLALPSPLCEDAWLQHGLAHALYFQGEERLEDAADFLEDCCKSLKAADMHPFLYTHMWFHFALVRVEQREEEDALQIFDEHLWNDAHADMWTDPQVQLNALNILWRLETRGHSREIGGRWAAVLGACEGVTLSRLTDTGPAPAQHMDLLLDVLIVRALCALGDKEARRLDRFLEAVEAHGAAMAASKAKGAKARASAYTEIARSVALLFRQDLPEASAPNREKEARESIKALRPWAAVGGSEEQRGVLLEAVEGPVVGGEPERNFSKLFF